MLPSALSGVGLLTTRCMMRFVRTRVLQSKVRPLLRTKAICAVTSKPGTSGTRRWVPFDRFPPTTLRRSKSVIYGPRPTMLQALPFRLSSYLLSLSPEVGVRSERAQDVVGAAHQHPPEHLVALPGDPLLGILLAGLVG